MHQQRLRLTVLQAIVFLKLSIVLFIYWQFKYENKMLPFINDRHALRKSSKQSKQCIKYSNRRLTEVVDYFTSVFINGHFSDVSTD